MTDAASSSFPCTAPRFTPPPGACDTHMHVFGPPSRYPYLPVRSYTTPDASLADYQRVRDRLGLARTVFVQPSVYGEDNRRLLDAMAQLGATARAVVVVGADVTMAELQALDAAGARGVRLNLQSVGLADPGRLTAALRPLAARIAELGWHIQLFMAPGLLPALASAAAELPVPLVVDHMGLLPASSFQHHPGWSAMCRLLEGGQTWVKLSGAYRVNDGVDGDYAMVTPLARALLQAAPERMLWGSDWPHTPRHDQQPTAAGTVTPFRGLDTGALLDLLADWAPDQALRQAVLSDNPARLYRFD